MMGSMVSFTLNDACMKAVADELPLAQAVFLRSAATTILMLILIRMLRAGFSKMSRRDRWLVRARNVTEVATAYFFITALFNMPIANATAIMQALPLTVTLASAVFLGQVIGWRRLTAILVGLSGVLLIVRPGLDGFNVYSLYVLAAVAMVTIRDVLSRKISANVPTITIALLNAVSVTIAFGLASIFIDWAPLSSKAAVQLGAASILIIGGYICAVSAMRVGEIAVVAPFRYTSLLAAMLFGFVAFNEFPDGLTLIGAAIVVATGVYTFYREQRLAQHAAPPHPPKQDC